MNTQTISRNVTKFRRYAPAVGQFRLSPSTSIPAIVVPKQPGQFTTALAHEVRNPLSNINLAVEMLRSTIMDEEQKIFLDIIMRSSGRINGLITDLLTSSRTAEIQPEKHCIHQLLDEVLVMSQDRIMLKKIMIRKDYSTLDCKILVNKDKMKIALTNIIINAIDAMPSEGGKLKLVTKTMNGRCIIEIEDNGIGISEKNLENIFTPYFTKKPGGMGLGLSTTLDILQSSHAKVDVRSVEGKGTRFILSFERNQQFGKYLFDGSIPIEA
jgi:signal transduction histidine kinase